MKTTKKTKKILYVILFLLLLALLGGGAWEVYQKNYRVIPLSELVDYESGDYEIPDYEAFFPEKFEKYKTDETYIGCRAENSDSESCLIMAISQKIKTVDDLVLCEDVALVEDVEPCRAMNSIGLGGFELCEGLSDVEFKNNCKMEVAISLAVKDLDLISCDVFGDPALKNTCIETAAGKIATDTKDKKWCDYIVSDFIKDLCIDNITNPADDM